MLIIKKKPILLLIAALFIIASGTAYAQCPVAGCPGKQSKPGAKAPGHDFMIPDLTDKQKEEMKTLQMALMKEILSMQNEIGEKEAHLRTLQTSAKVDMSEINKAIEDIGQLRIKMMKLKAAHHQKVRSLLTDEQRVFFDTHKKPHKGPAGNPEKPPCHGP